MTARALGYRVFVDLKRRLLWRVRRKLTLSYIFIGFVPALLIIVSSWSAGMLLFLNVSCLHAAQRITALVDQTRFLAETAAHRTAGRADHAAKCADMLARRRQAAVARYPLRVGTPLCQRTARLRRRARSTRR